jgi:hypothetical protein
VITDREAETGRRPWLVPVAGLLVVLLVAVWWPGCRKYPAVTSKESLSLMKLLYAACNTREEGRLKMAEEKLAKLTQEGKLSEAERESFAEIVGMARSGSWERAERAAFRFAQDQVGQGSEATRDPHDHSHEKKTSKGKGRPKGS